MVCPMRVFLVLASTFIAGYLAWVSWNKQASVSSISTEDGEDAKNPQSSQTSDKSWQSLRGNLQLAFDMVSGRYLYEQWKLHRKPGTSLEGKVD
jgi:hypothetical protein